VTLLYCSRWGSSMTGFGFQMDLPVYTDIYLTICAWAGIAQLVCILATDCKSEDWIPVGTRFSAPVQTRPGAHPASYTMGTGLFPGVKRPGRGIDHPSHPAPRLKKPLLPPWAFVACSRVNVTFIYLLFDHMCTHFRLAQNWIGTGPSGTQYCVNQAVSILIQMLF